MGSAYNTARTHSKHHELTGIVISKNVKPVLILTDTESASSPAMPINGLPDRSSLERTLFSGKHSAIAIAAVMEPS
jgi:hypothetical protein